MGKRTEGAGTDRLLSSSSNVTEIGLQFYCSSFHFSIVNKRFIIRAQPTPAKTFTTTEATRPPSLQLCNFRGRGSMHLYLSVILIHHQERFRSMLCSVDNLSVGRQNKTCCQCDFYSLTENVIIV